MARFMMATFSMLYLAAAFLIALISDATIFNIVVAHFNLFASVLLGWLGGEIKD